MVVHRDAADSSNFGRWEHVAASIMKIYATPKPIMAKIRSLIKWGAGLIGLKPARA